ncbi:MAG: asparagine--tRNA ligase, partial [Planctomycetaceae bacterium]|nr:asparagine--tRNA ligase [Planctomycetaceae bacterium]
MVKMTVLAARQAQAIGSQVMIQGWVRTRRDSKGGFSFIEINDGSCMANLQIIADADLDNYESEITRLTAGCSISVSGEIKESGGKQATEILAAKVEVHGWAD